MDATVDDFLKEINEIVPPAQKTPGNSKPFIYYRLMYFYNLYFSMERMLR